VWGTGRRRLLVDGQDFQVFFFASSCDKIGSLYARVVELVDTPDLGVRLALGQLFEMRV